MALRSCTHQMPKSQGLAPLRAGSDEALYLSKCHTRGRINMWWLVVPKVTALHVSRCGLR